MGLQLLVQPSLPCVPPALVLASTLELASHPPFDAHYSVALYSWWLGLSPLFHPMHSYGPQLSVIWPPNLVLVSSVQWDSTLPISSSHPSFSLQFAMGFDSPRSGLPPLFQPLVSSKSRWFGFLRALWSSTRSLASTLRWASHHHFGLLSLFWLSHCNSPLPSFWSPILQWASHAWVSLCSVVRPPCLIWPLLLSQPSHALSSLLLCHGPSTLGSASHVVLGLSSLFSLPCSVWFPLCVQPPMLCLASSLLWASCSWSGLFLPGGPALSVWPLLPSGPPPVFPHSSFSSRGRMPCCGLSAAPLWVWRGCAVPASPRAAATHWQQEHSAGRGDTLGFRAASGAGAVALKRKPGYAGHGAGTARDSSFLHNAEIDLCWLQASKLEKQSSVSESDYDNPTTPLELEETG